jgi:hypothetical protein
MENPTSARVHIAPAFGPSREVIGQVSVGGVIGNVVEGLSGSLVSVADAVDRGWTVVLSKDDSRLLNIKKKEKIPLIYRDRTWWIDLANVGEFIQAGDHRGSMALKKLLYPHDLYHGGKALSMLRMKPSAESKVVGEESVTSKKELDCIRMVIHIHNVMGHASLKTMTAAIKPGGC